MAIEDCKRLGIVLAGAATTADEARALEQVRVDVVVASGFEAGETGLRFWPRQRIPIS